MIRRRQLFAIAAIIFEVMFRRADIIDSYGAARCA